MRTPLTLQQSATIQAAILAEPALAGALAAFNDEAVRVWCNTEAAPAFVVWRTAVSPEEIFGAITWKNFTPLDAPPPLTATDLEMQLWKNRAIAAQCAQMNIQTMLMGRTTPLNPSNQKIRDGLRDALQGLPTGAGGDPLDAGWNSGVKAVCTRAATNIERILATGGGTMATPGQLVVEGPATLNDIVTILRP